MITSRGPLYEVIAKDIYEMHDEIDRIMDPDHNLQYMDGTSMLAPVVGDGECKWEDEHQISLIWHKDTVWTNIWWGAEYIAQCNTLTHKQ